MSLEQKLEQSEQLLETNEKNKLEEQNARRAAQQAQNQVRVSTARVQQAQNQLQQAVAAKNAAQQRASDDNNRSSSTASYDAEISRAREALSAANRELQAAHREQIRAEGNLEHAEEVHRESAEKLSGVVDELQAVAQKYNLEMGKTQALMNAPEGRLASPLYARLGAGRERVNDLRRRIAASLGIALPSDGAAASGGYRGCSRGSRGAAGSGAGDPGAYQSPYVKTTFSGPITYTDPKTGQRVTKMSTRTVYQNRNLDPGMVVPAGTRRSNGSVLKEDTTNLELMRSGRSPFIAVTRSDGSTHYQVVELHHLSGEETQYSSPYFRGESLDGSMVEIQDDVHDKYDRELHGLTASSFRKDADGNKTADDAKYKKFREDYWKHRAAMYEAGS